jgi:hypothetical protein
VPAGSPVTTRRSGDRASFTNSHAPPMARRPACPTALMPVIRGARMQRCGTTQQLLPLACRGRSDRGFFARGAVPGDGAEDRVGARVESNQAAFAQFPLQEFPAGPPSADGTHALRRRDRGVDLPLVSGAERRALERSSSVARNRFELDPRASQ